MESCDAAAIATHRRHGFWSVNRRLDDRRALDCQGFEGLTKLCCIVTYSLGIVALGGNYSSGDWVRRANYCNRDDYQEGIEISGNLDGTE